MVATVEGPAHQVTNTYEPNRNVLLTKAKQRGSDNAIINSVTYEVNSIAIMQGATEKISYNMRRFMSKIIYGLMLFSFISLNSCGKNNFSFKDILKEKPLNVINIQKGIDSVSYLIYRKDYDEKFEDFLNKLENSKLWEGYTRSNHLYTIEIANDPNSVLFNQEEIKRASYHKSGSKSKFIVVEYSDYLVICVLIV